MLLKEECYKIIGARMSVHKELGSAFLESVYQEALALEFTEQNIPFVKEKALDVYYRGNKLEKVYYADFLCYDRIIVELKVANSIAEAHVSQALHYLAALKMNVALVVNFGEAALQWKRVIL